MRSTARLRIPLVVLSWVVAPLLPAPPLSAQSANTSAVRGTVTQADGTPIAGAAVVVRQVQTGTQRGADTDADGRYLVRLLQPGGPYTVTVTHIGFSEVQREDIELLVGETNLLDFVLLQQAIEIEGINVGVDRAEIFNPTVVGPATLITERTVESIPILSRDFMELAVLSPLVKTTEGGGFSIAGQNDRYNAILVDGALNKDAFGLTAGGVPGGQAGAKLIPLDAVSQYEVLIAPFDVRLTGFTGGVMNAVTRTGTNEWRVRGFGVARDEVLIGDLSLPTGPVEASGVDRRLMGASVGGPIITDRAHFFVTGEFESRTQPPDGYNLQRDDPSLVRISPESMTALQDLFETSFGEEAGLAEPYPLDQQLANVFARMDWDLGGGHRLTLRNVFAHAANDESPNRFFDPYGLSSNAVDRSSTTNTTSIQLFSEIGATGANELDINIQRSSDESTPASAFPQVEVDLGSSIDGTAFVRPVRLGSQFFAQENDLSQTSVRVTNSVSFINDRSNYTVGLTGAFYDVGQRFLPGSRGDWFFANLNDVQNNAPQRYQRTVLLDGQDPTVDFSVMETGLFIQNQIDSGKGLTMHFGLRFDMPFVFGHPEENPEVLDLFGYSTSQVPNATLFVSPRWGFNWQSEGDLTTQVRGGAGLFTGQLPYVWLANAYHNNGLRQVTLVCEGRRTDDPATGNTVPAFTTGEGPTTCLRGAPTEVRTITMFDQGFKYPQDMKFSVAVDQQLTPRLSASLGVLFNQAINQVVLEELNLGDPPSQVGPLLGYGGFERQIHGRPVSNGFEPTFDEPAYDQVLLATNDSDDWSYSVTAELRGSLNDRVSFQSGYTYARSYDRMSLVFTDMVSNYGFNPSGFNPNETPRAISNFDRPHKFVAAIYGAPFESLPNTEISLLYTGQSGVPFSYVYQGDLNGDGYPGLGASFDRYNDLIFVPEEATDIPGTPATWQLLNSALQNDECLNANRGEIIKRNVCRAPWQNRLDVRVSHAIRRGDTEIRFEADMINFLNLINSDWGKIETVPSVVALIEPFDRREAFGSGVGELVSRWSGGVLPARDEQGNLTATNPWSVATPESQWQAQFGVRVTFGR